MVLVYRRCRCRRGDMAGVGRDCGRHRPGRRSCLADGIIDVLSRRRSVKHRQRPCSFVKRLTTGVLCCKRPEKWQLGQSVHHNRLLCDQCRVNPVLVHRVRQFCQLIEHLIGLRHKPLVCINSCVLNIYLWAYVYCIHVCHCLLIDRPTDIRYKKQLYTMYLITSLASV